VKETQHNRVSLSFSIHVLDDSVMPVISDVTHGIFMRMILRRHLLKLPIYFGLDHQWVKMEIIYELKIIESFKK
jgi:hypothetical protein